MSEKRYIVTKNQIFKSIRFALESNIESRSFVECVMDDMENILDFDCFEEYKESEEPCDDCISRETVLRKFDDSDVDLDVMLNACASAVNAMLEDGTAFFIRNDKGKYDQYGWETILDWLAEVHEALFGESEG